jgi:serine/threonine-protein kinase
MPPRDPTTESSAATTPLHVDATEPVGLVAGADRPVSIAPVNPSIAPASGGGFDGRYREKGMLGEGGMGEVRLCEDQQIGRDVAVKVVRADVLRRPDAVARFVREARVQGQLEHPAIVPVHDLGVTPDGAAYFTMKRVRGVTLADIVRARSTTATRRSPRASRSGSCSRRSSACRSRSISRTSAACCTAI